MTKKYLGWFFIVGLFSMILMAIVVTEGYKQQYYWHEMNTFMRIVFVWGLGGGFLLWFWMLGAHFKGSATKHPIIWGFMLLFAHIMAAVLYFIFVYSRAVPNETALTKGVVVIYSGALVGEALTRFLDSKF